MAAKRTNHDSGQAGLVVLSAYGAAASLLAVVCMTFTGDVIGFIAGRRTTVGVLVQLAVFAAMVTMAGICGDSIIARLREILSRVFR
jgi:hypothetical protein